MARNKYPEIIIEKILEISLKLFNEKGYDKTSIQDIVNQSDFTKGAICYHFHSKEEIVETLSKQIFIENFPIFKISKNNDLNGLEKLKMIIQITFELSITSKKIKNINHNDNMKNFHLYFKINKIHSTTVEKIIEEGNKDGSIHVKWPKATSEIFIFLLNYWLSHFIFSGNIQEFKEWIKFLKQILDTAFTCMKYGLIFFDG